MQMICSVLSDLCVSFPPRSPISNSVLTSFALLLIQALKEAGAQLGIPLDVAGRWELEDGGGQCQGRLHTTKTLYEQETSTGQNRLS